MKDYEDDPAFTCFEHSPFDHPQTLDDLNESVLPNNDGTLVGKIYQVSEGGMCNKLPLNVRDKLQKVTNAVLRLFAIYRPLSGGTTFKISTGTAFAISPTVLLTARHCVKPKHTDDTTSEILYLSNIYVDSSNTTRVEVFDSSHPNVNEVTLIDRDLYIKPSEDNNYLLTSDGSHWKHSNDFSLLKFSKYQHTNYIQKFSHTLSNKAYVVGYPADITMEKFFEDYTSRLETRDKCEKLWLTVSKAMGYFETKIISEGEATASQDEKTLSTHHCPTLRGTSGSVVLNSSGEMIGIHIGGSYDINCNFWIPVTDKHLAASLQFVLKQ